MPVYVIDTLKPKNGLDFPVVEAADVAVEGYASLAEAVTHFATDTAIAAINAALSDKANTSDVNTAVANLQAQIDQIEISASAESVVAPEVAAARVGADGTDYPTLKARLDANEQSLDSVEAEVAAARVGDDGLEYLTLKNRLDHEQEKISDRIGAVKSEQHESAVTVTEAQNGLKEINGELDDTESTQNYLHTYISGVSVGDKFTIRTNVGTASSYPYYIYAIDNTTSKTVIGRYAPKESSIQYNKSYDITVPDGATALAIMRYKGDNAITATNIVEDITDLQTQVDNISEYIPQDINMHDTSTDVSGIINENGVVAEDASYKTTQFIPVFAGYTYTISDSCRRFLAFDSDREVINGTYDNTAYGDNPKTFTATVNGSFRFSFATSENPSVSVTYEGSPTKKNQEGINLSDTQKDQVNAAILPVKQYIESHDVYMPQDVDLHDTSTDVSGLISENGVVSENASYTTTDFIKIKSGFTYTINRKCRKFVAFDSDREVINGTYDATDYGNNPKTYSAAQDGYIRYSFQNAEPTSVTETFSGTPTLKNCEGVLLSETQKQQVETNIYNQDVLYGKKWVVVGDSFTNGGTYDDIISGGLYDGMPALYHYLIGNRHMMDIVHFAAGGRTLTTPENVLVHNCFSDTESTYNYTDIPADADYITIWLGINDSKAETGEAPVGLTPLGTIDDDTVHTFYGAWNVVLEYLIEHYPYAHIGIIVSNGCTGTNYPDAIKEAARKWGIAYLDLNGDYTVPLMHRVNGKSEVCERAIELRKSAFWVSESNGHPNAHAQKYQSTFIENWLKSL